MIHIVFQEADIAALEDSLTAFRDEIIVSRMAFLFSTTSSS